jgi:methylated-DNA-[protein]-cysteine S-methyltransferase
MNVARASIETPFGLSLVIDCDETNVVASEFVRRAQPLQKRITHAVLREAAQQARAYFNRRLRRFDLPLRLNGTAFQNAVWTFVSEMETGELISYSDLARAVGSPRAARGVAAAMARTPIDLFIPAHRVVGADGTVRGAGAGSVRRALLKFEGITLR